MRLITEAQLATTTTVSVPVVFFNSHTIKPKTLQQKEVFNDYKG